MFQMHRFSRPIDFVKFGIFQFNEILHELMVSLNGTQNDGRGMVLETDASMCGGSPLRPAYRNEMEVWG